MPRLQGYQLFEFGGRYRFHWRSFLSSAAVADPTAPRIKALVADMVETLDDIGGAGLAAPQVHVSERVVVFKDGLVLEDRLVEKRRLSRDELQEEARA